MPKPSKQQRIEREEDCIAQATNANSDAKASSSANFSELSTDALLKMISAAVAEKGQRIQMSVKESFDKFESMVDSKLDNIIKPIDDVVAKTDSLKARI